MKLINKICYMCLWLCLFVQPCSAGLTEHGLAVLEGVCWNQGADCRKEQTEDLIKMCVDAKKKRQKATDPMEKLYYKPTADMCTDTAVGGSNNAPVSGLLTDYQSYDSSGEVVVDASGGEGEGIGVDQSRELASAAQKEQEDTYQDILKHVGENDKAFEKTKEEFKKLKELLSDKPERNKNSESEYEVVFDSDTYEVDGNENASAYFDDDPDAWYRETEEERRRAMMSDAERELYDFEKMTAKEKVNDFRKNHPKLRALLDGLSASVPLPAKVALTAAFNDGIPKEKVVEFVIERTVGKLTKQIKSCKNFAERQRLESQLVRAKQTQWIAQVHYSVEQYYPEE